MLADLWPLRNLRLTTPRLELRWPSEEELAGVAAVAAEGVHDPDFMPFLVPWTDASPPERARSVIQHFWRKAGTWSHDDWSVLFVVFHDDQPIGIQVVGAQNFAVVREVGTGSWLGQRFHRQGFGTEMRAAVLEFAFTGLGASTAVSSAMIGNDSSLGVSRKLGYRHDGLAHHCVQGAKRVEQRLRLDRVDWRAPFPVPIYGLDLREFGL